MRFCDKDTVKSYYVSQLDTVNVERAFSHTVDAKTAATVPEHLGSCFVLCFCWHEVAFILEKGRNYFTEARCLVAFSESGPLGREEGDIILTDSHLRRCLERGMRLCGLILPGTHAVCLQLLAPVGTGFVQARPPSPAANPEPALSASFLSLPAGQGQPSLLESVMSCCLDSMSISCLLSHLRFCFSAVSFK